MLMFAVIAIASAWAGTVSLIHWRGVTTGMSPRNKSKSKCKSTVVKRGLWMRMLAGMNRSAKKTKHAALQSGEGVDGDGEVGMATVTSAHDIPAQPKDRTYSSLSPVLSPPNPYLVPLGPSLRSLHQRREVRGSGEWAAEHRAFFSSVSGSAAVAFHSRASSSSHSLSDSELEDVESEAREAQDRPLIHKRDMKDEKLPWKARISWVDLGLAMMDGAVDKVAAGIVRWADDNDGDEALVLPLAKGKRG
jgi:hypothetical protein